MFEQLFNFIAKIPNLLTNSEYLGTHFELLKFKIIHLTSSY